MNQAHANMSSECICCAIIGLILPVHIDTLDAFRPTNLGTGNPALRLIPAMTPIWLPDEWTTVHRTLSFPLVSCEMLKGVRVCIGDYLSAISTGIF